MRPFTARPSLRQDRVAPATLPASRKFAAQDEFEHERPQSATAPTNAGALQSMTGRSEAACLANLGLAAGNNVIIVGLQLAPAFNGVFAKVVGWLATHRRVKVQLSNGDEKLLKPINLQKVPDAPSTDFLEHSGKRPPSTEFIDDYLEMLTLESKAPSPSSKAYREALEDNRLLQKKVVILEHRLNMSNARIQRHLLSEHKLLQRINDLVPYPGLSAHTLEDLVQPMLP